MRIWSGLGASALLLLLVVGTTLPIAAGRYVAEPLTDATRTDATRARSTSAEATEQASADRPAEDHPRIAASRPKGVFAVVDTYNNRFRLYGSSGVLRDTACSSGSGAVLTDPRTGKEWVFDSPLGERRVERKRRNPVWMKPDWAFVEDGFEPPEDVGARADADSLGDYGLYLGDGYLIHGTLFQTLLGRNITHGCIRLGDEDLEYVYRRLPVGARVFFY